MGEIPQHVRRAKVASSVISLRAARAASEIGVNPLRRQGLAVAHSFPLGSRWYRYETVPKTVDLRNVMKVTHYSNRICLVTTAERNGIVNRHSMIPDASRRPLMQARRRHR